MASIRKQRAPIALFAVEFREVRKHPEAKTTNIDDLDDHGAAPPGSRRESTDWLNGLLVLLAEEEQRATAT